MTTDLAGRRVTDIYRLEILNAAFRVAYPKTFDSPPRASVIHLRGVLAATAGQLSLAIACCLYAVSRDPGHVDYYHDLAELLSRSGRGREAVAARLRAVVLRPNDPVSLCLLARTLHTHRHLFEALAAYSLVLTHEPVHPAARRGVADVLASLRRFDDALVHYRLLLQAHSADPHILCDMGSVLLEIGDCSAALSRFYQAIALESSCVRAWRGVGRVMTALNLPQDAEQAFRNALLSDPFDVGTASELASHLDMRGLRRESAHALLHLAQSLESENHYQLAREAYADAVDRCPDSIPGMLGLAHMHLALREPRAALPLLEAALAKRPHNVKAHIDLGAALHLSGQADRGWDELRWHYNPLVSERYPQPIWDGSSLAGKTILLWTDMGRGDVVQFLRYVQFVRRQGPRTIIVLSHHHGLAPLVACALGVDRVVVPGAPLPDFDVHAPLILFPARYADSRTDATLHHVPYLSLGGVRLEEGQHRVRLCSCLNIGLSWAGNAETRSAHSRFVSLDAFAPLGDVPRTHYVSLQHGPQADELLTSPPSLMLEDVGMQQCSIIDMAALLMELDLVVTVDTLVAHVAGALGRPVWLLLRYSPNWRWPLEGEKTYWYPTMRLFRQRSLDSWTSVFEDVRGELLSLTV